MSNVVSPRGRGGEVGQEPRRVVPRSDLLDPKSAPKVSLVPDPARGNVVLARFWNGDHTCYGAMPQVTETADAVIVEIFTGVLPEAEGKPCKAVAELQELEIQLAAPLGNRPLR